MTSRLFLALLLLPLAARAQDSLPPTHADTLRGSITPERAWWDVDLLRSPRDGLPGATAASRATTASRTACSRPRARCRSICSSRSSSTAWCRTAARSPCAATATPSSSRSSPQQPLGDAQDDHRLLPRQATRREASAVGRRLHLGTRHARPPLDRDRQPGTRRQRLVAEQGHPGRRAGQPARGDHACPIR